MAGSTSSSTTPASESLGNIDEISVEDLDREVASNVRSVFLFTRAVVPILKEAGSGNIVNVASISGLKGFGGASAYVATVRHGDGESHRSAITNPS